MPGKTHTKTFDKLTKHQSYG